MSNNDSNRVIPNYYLVALLPKELRAGRSDGTVVECTDVIHALDLDHDLGAALKYLWRAGRKNEDIEDELKKVLTYVGFKLNRVRAEKATIAANASLLAAPSIHASPAPPEMPRALIPDDAPTNATWLCERCNEPKASKERYMVPNTFAPSINALEVRVCAKCHSELKKEERHDVVDEEKPVP